MENVIGEFRRDMVCNCCGSLFPAILARIQGDFHTESQNYENRGAFLAIFAIRIALEGQGNESRRHRGSTALDGPCPAA